MSEKDVLPRVERIRFEQIGLAFAPVALTPILVFALAEGWIDLGGGEKDILAAFPYFVFTLTFFVVAAVLILRRWPLARWALRASVVATALLLCLGVAAYWLSWLGVA